MKYIIVAVLAALNVLSARAEVVHKSGNQEISIELGAFRPTAKFGINGVTGDKGERFGGTGFLFIVDYLHDVSSFLSLGIEALNINRGTYETKNLAFAAQFAGASTQVRGNTQGLLATVGLRSAGSTRAHLLAGMGVQKTTLDMFMQSPPGTYWGAGFGPEITVVSGSVSGFMGTLRAGIEKEFIEGGTLGLDIGYIAIPPGTYVRTPTGRGILTEDIVTRGDGLTIGAKFGYRFGRGY